MKYGGKPCDECDLPMEACNHIASQRLSIERLEREVRRLKGNVAAEMLETGSCGRGAVDLEIYPDELVLEQLARLSEHTCDELQSRIQAVYMWMREQR